MDIVFTTTEKPENDFIELRYSLRSVEKHARGIRDIYILGPAPDWIQGVKQIYMPDDNEYRTQNVHDKLMTAANDPAITEQFFYMADDHYLTQDILPLEYPFFSTGSWRDEKSVAFQFLKMIEKPTENFDAHTPITLKKSEYLQTPWSALPEGHIPIRTFYSNYWQKHPTLCADPILVSNYSVEMVRKVGKNTACVSGGDKSPEFEAYLRTMKELYPRKSRCEK